MKEPLYNSRIILNYVRLVEKKYPYVDLKDVLRTAGMERYQVDDEGHWFSQEQVNRFHQRLGQLVWNKDIAREAGLFASSPESLGSLRIAVCTFLGPDHSYSLFTRNVSRFSRSSVYESKKLGPQATEITVTPKPGVREESFQCANRLGYIEAMARSINLQFPRIEHPECMFRGDGRCRYVVSWASSAERALRAVTISGILLVPALLFLFSRVFSFQSALTYLLPWAIVVFLALAVIQRQYTVHTLRLMLGTVREVSEDLFDQNQENYDLARCVREIGNIIGAHNHDLDPLLQQVAAVMEEFLFFERGIIFLADDKGERLQPRAWYGVTTEQLDVVRTYPGQRLDPSMPSGISAMAYLLQKPFLVDDIERVRGELSPDVYEFARQMGIKSYITCPVIYAGKSLGVLSVDNRRTKRPLQQRDLDLLMGIASLVGVGIHATLMGKEHRERQRSFFRLARGE